jgi:hypothetical protein
MAHKAEIPRFDLILPPQTIVGSDLRTMGGGIGWEWIFGWAGGDRHGFHDKTR